jgi:hypothetical protein
MAHWVQYHTPVRMGCGIDEGEGPPFAVLSDKVPFTDDGGPIGEVVWLVGLRDEPGGPVYLGEWFVIDDVQPSDHEEFDYCYIGEEGASLRPMPVLSGRPWFGALLRLTGDFRFGLTQVPPGRVLDGLRAAAAEAGFPEE